MLKKSTILNSTINYFYLCREVWENVLINTDIIYQYMFFPSHMIELNICWDNLEPKNFYILCFLNQRTRIPGTAEPGGLPSMGSHRVGHNRSNLAAAAAASLCKQCINLSQCLHNYMYNPSLMTCLTFFYVLIKHLSPELDTEFTEDRRNILLSFKPWVPDTETSFNKYMLEESVNSIV